MAGLIGTRFIYILSVPFDLQVPLKPHFLRQAHSAHLDQSSAGKVAKDA